ncbi:MAG: hypothetical protein ACP5HJ_03550, partial [Candidatus Micrarchaeia archaeon]
MQKYIFLLLFPFVFANYIQIVSPIKSLVFDNSSVFLGNAAPGESIYIEALSQTTFNNTLFEIGWSQMNVTALPQGWESTPTKL